MGGCEAVKMSILEIGIEQGMQQGIEQGIEQGIKVLIKTCQELNVPRTDIATRLMQEFSIKKDTAEEYLGKYWKHST